MVTLFVKTIYKKPERKICSESRDIDENKIVQGLVETFGIFRWLAAEWRRIAFVYDVKGNMAIATSIDARGDWSHRKRQVLRKWKMAMCRRNLLHYDLRVCTELQNLTKTVSRFCFYAYKNYKNGNFA